MSDAPITTEKALIYPKASAPTTAETARAANERADRWELRYTTLKMRVEALAADWHCDDPGCDREGGDLIRDALSTPTGSSRGGDTEC